MTQHRVIAEDSLSAMDEISKVLGNDAVILETKKINGKIEILGSNNIQDVALRCCLSAATEAIESQMILGTGGKLAASFDALDLSTDNGVNDRRRPHAHTRSLTLVPTRVSALCRSTRRSR